MCAAFEVPLTIRLDRLHLVLQAAMGGAGSRFRWRSQWNSQRRVDQQPSLRDPRPRHRLGRARPGLWCGPLDARKARLVDVLEDTGVRSLKYLYDFGDGWEHSVRIDRITDAVPGIAYPRLVEASGRCPPEDVGGPWGYRDFLEAIADPDHEQHAESATWVGEDFDLAALDVERLANDLAALAKRWSRTPTTRRTRST